MRAGSTARRPDTREPRLRRRPLWPSQLCSRGPLERPEDQDLIQVLRVGDKIAGFLVRTETGIAFRRVVDVDRHLLRVPEPSWCFDISAVRRAEEAGAVRAEVHDRHSGACWWMPLGHLLRVGEQIEFGPHGLQLRLPLREFSYLPGRKEEAR